MCVCVCVCVCVRVCMLCCLFEGAHMLVNSCNMCVHVWCVRYCSAPGGAVACVKSISVAVSQNKIAPTNQKSLSVGDTTSPTAVGSEPHVDTYHTVTGECAHNCCTSGTMAVYTNIAETFCNSPSPGFCLLDGEELHFLIRPVLMIDMLVWGLIGWID